MSQDLPPLARHVLSLEQYMEWRKSYCGDQIKFPITTEQLISMLGSMGIRSSNPAISRAVEAIEDFAVPKFGRSLAWEPEQINRLWLHTLGNTGEIRGCPVPYQLTAATAWFWHMDISAWEWCQKHMEFERRHGKKITHNGAHVFRPWHSIPYGARLVISSSIDELHSFQFEVDEGIAGGEQ